MDEVDMLKARIAELEQQLKTTESQQDRFSDGSSTATPKAGAFKLKFGVVATNQLVDPDPAATRNAAAAIAEFLRMHKIDDELNARVSPETLGLTGPHTELCSFCKEPQDKVKKLILGDAVSICDECVGLCNEILS